MDKLQFCSLLDFVASKRTDLLLLLLLLYYYYNYYYYCVQMNLVDYDCALLVTSLTSAVVQASVSGKQPCF